MEVMLKKSIGILGAGAFGTALAIVYHKLFNVSLFSCFENHVSDMKNSRINEFFPDIRIPNNINIELTENLRNYKFDYIFWVFPISPTKELLMSFKNYLNQTNIIICSKGILSDSTFLSDLFRKNLPNSSIGYLAGPNFAIELANNNFSAADIAFKYINKSIQVANELSIENFKLNPIDDMIGAQICGAMKNIIAIGAGLINGLNFGKNTYAAYLNLALKEMKTLGIALDAKEETFYGLCGLGDLILTTSSSDSRNTSLGINIAQGKNINEAISKSACEGYSTLKQVLTLADNNNISLPICNVIYKIIFESFSPDSILNVFK